MKTDDWGEQRLIWEYIISDASSHDIVVWSKSYCKDCNLVERLLKQHFTPESGTTIQVHDLNLIPDGAQVEHVLRQILLETTRPRRTSPADRAAAKLMTTDTNTTDTSNNGNCDSDKKNVRVLPPSAHSFRTWQHSNLSLLSVPTNNMREACYYRHPRTRPNDSQTTLQTQNDWKHDISLPIVFLQNHIYIGKAAVETAFHEGELQELVELLKSHRGADGHENPIHHSDNINNIHSNEDCIHNN